ncbi:S8 family serine peptidase [Actinoallomurus sp. CA-150999]|uniref:S8 family serine peptidase n=1 Tax=Actinoallomurus sp. CA-150999 TaxID=3239887 RepID=UPI003D9237A2
MRRKLLSAATATAVAAALLGIPPIGPASAAPATSDAVGKAAHGPTITLLTGDTVRLDKAPDGTQTGTVVTDVGPQGDIVFQQMNGDLYALNGQVVRLIGQGRLDRELFDLTRLAADGYDDAHTDQLPVITTYRPGHVTAKAAPRWMAKQRALPSVRAQAQAVRKADAASALAELTRSGSDVQKVWLDGKARASLDVSVPAVGAPAAWAAGYTGRGVKVAVLDTGIDAAHPDFAGRIVARHNFVPGDADDVHDKFGHGTHVASILAGTGAASGGKYRGVAPDADLVIGKVLDDSGNGTDSEIIAGMEWAAGQGAKVVNMSIGSMPTDGTDPLAQAVNRISDANGTLFVVAAGNNGHSGATLVESPGSADRALTVGSVDKSGTHDVSSFSSAGPRIGDNAVKPEITAPGSDIVAARATGGIVGDPVDAHYTQMSGTSMATPHVAGGAVLLAQEHPDWTRDQLKDALVSAADPGNLPNTPVTWQGGGMLDLKQATAGGLVATGTLDIGMIAPPYPATATGTVTFRNPGGKAVHADLGLDLFSMDKKLMKATAFDPGDKVTVSPSAVDVPAGGTATATVTVHLADLAVGAYYGYLRAGVEGADTVRTTIGFTKDPQRAKLTVRGIDRNGVPETTTQYSWVNLMDLENGRVWPGWFENGVANFDLLGPDPRIPVGRYAVLGNIAGFPVDPPYWNTSETIGGDPELNLTKDTTINIDARLGKPVRFKTHLPAEEAGDQALTMEWKRVVGPAGHQLGMLRQSIGARADLYVIPGGGDTTTGTFTMDVRATLVAPTLTMAAHGHGAPRVLHARYAHDGDLCGGYVPCVAPFRSPGAYSVVDAGNGTPDELAAAKVKGRVALVHEVAPDPNRLSTVDKVTADAAAGGAAGVLIAIGDAGPAWRYTNDHTTIPVAVLTRTEGEQLTKAVKTGPVTITTGGQAVSPYLYNLTEHLTGRLPNDLTFTADPRNLATVTARYHGDSPGWIYSVLGRIGGIATKVKAPYVRTEYVSPGDQGWYPWLSHFRDFWTNESNLSAVTLTAGQHVTADYGTGPVGPGRGSQMNVSWSGPEWGGYIGFSYLSLFAIGTGQRYLHQFGDEPVHFRILHNGQVLCDKTNATPCPVSTADPGRYRLELDATNRQRDTSTSTHTAWEVDAAFDKASAPLPMLSFGYDVPLDLLNSVAGGSKYTARINTAYQTAYKGSGPFTVDAWVSHDGGKTWTGLGSRTTDEAGDARFAIRSPKGAKAVTLRVKATDAHGDSVDQTINDAWHVH